MPELELANTHRQTRKHSRPNKLSLLANRYTALGAAALALLAAGSTLRRANNANNQFYTDIPVPTETQPHIDYTVQTGDTELGITRRFNLGFDNTDYENMINKQIPKSDRHERNLRPGEHLRLPPETE